MACCVLYVCSLVLQPRGPAPPPVVVVDQRARSTETFSRRIGFGHGVGHGPPQAPAPEGQPCPHRFQQRSQRSRRTAGPPRPEELHAGNNDGAGLAGGGIVGEGCDRLAQEGNVVEPSVGVEVDGCSGGIGAAPVEGERPPSTSDDTTNQPGPTGVPTVKPRCWPRARTRPAVSARALTRGVAPPRHPRAGVGGGRRRG